MFELQTSTEKLDWHQDWTDWVEEGDTIQDSIWTIDPSSTGMLSGDNLDAEENLTTVFVEGLEPGITYQLRNTVETSGGRIGQRDIILRCVVSR